MFLLAPVDEGGLGMSQMEVGFAYGVLAIVGLTIGGIIGGIVAANGGLRKWIWPMALATSLNCVAYIILSQLQPDYATMEDLLGNSYQNFFFWVLGCNLATWLVTALVRPHIDPKYGAKNN